MAASQPIDLRRTISASVRRTPAFATPFGGSTGARSPEDAHRTLRGEGKLAIVGAYCVAAGFTRVTADLGLLPGYLPSCRILSSPSTSDCSIPVRTRSSSMTKLPGDFALLLSFPNLLPLVIFP